MCAGELISNQIFLFWIIHRSSTWHSSISRISLPSAMQTMQGLDKQSQIPIHLAMNDNLCVHHSSSHHQRMYTREGGHHSHLVRTKFSIRESLSDINYKLMSDFRRSARWWERLWNGCCTWARCRWSSTREWSRGRKGRGGSHLATRMPSATSPSATARSWSSSATSRISNNCRGSRPSASKTSSTKKPSANLVPVSVEMKLKWDLSRGWFDCLKKSPSSSNPWRVPFHSFSTENG